MRTIKWRKLYIKVSLRTMWIPGNFKGTSYLAWKSCSWRYPYSKCEETPWRSTCSICDDKIAQNYHLSEHDSLARIVNIERLQRDILLSMKRLCMKVSLQKVWTTTVSSEISILKHVLFLCFSFYNWYEWYFKKCNFFGQLNKFFWILCKYLLGNWTQISWETTQNKAGEIGKGYPRLPLCRISL